MRETKKLYCREEHFISDMKCQTLVWFEKTVMLANGEITDNCKEWGDLLKDKKNEAGNL